MTEPPEHHTCRYCRETVILGKRGWRRPDILGVESYDCPDAPRGYHGAGQAMTTTGIVRYMVHYVPLNSRSCVGAITVGEIDEGVYLCFSERHRNIGPVSHNEDRQPGTWHHATHDASARAD
jgi:hypothetical protein